MKFTLPDQLPVTVAELEALADQAVAEIRVFQARATAGDEFSPDDVERLDYLTTSHATITTAATEAAAGELSHQERLDSALGRAAAATAEPEAEASEDDGEGDGGEGGTDAGAEVVAEAEAATAEAAEEGATVTAGAANGAPVTFGVSKNDIPAAATTPVGEKPKGWDLLPSAPKFAEFGEGKVGFAEIAKALSSVNPGQGTGRQKTGQVTMPGQGEFATQAVARLIRPQETPIEDAHDVYPALDRICSEIPGHGKATAQSLTAAGGWCAPSEQVYTFCAVPPASDLVSLPDFPVSMNRGGVRFPVNPDVSALLDDLFHYTETELEAVDGGGDPTAVKPIIELPCPDEFIEYRLEAIGWAAKAGILQRQAWPESIENALEQISVAHQHRVSQLTIGKMVAGSGTVKVVPTDTILGATSSVLNGLALQAANLRYNIGFQGDSTIEGVAPVWFREVLRADLALREDKDSLAVTNAEIDSWLSARNIYLQYASDTQTRGSGQPGNMATDRWPGFADVLLYPAGTWFRSLNNVITLGVQYPIQQLVLNQYTHIFTEDSFQVGKRCYQSINVRVPLCVNGAIGAREQITCTYLGAATLTKTLTVTGTPTGGSFPLNFTGLGGKSATIAFNSTAAQAKTALAAMDDNIAAAAFTVTGGALPGTPLVITYPAELGTASATGTGLTGGTTPAAAVT